MRIALCTPVDVHALAHFCGRSTEGMASGLGSTVATPLVIELLQRGHEVSVYTLSNDLSQEQMHVWDRLKIVVGPSRRYHAARNFYRPEIAFLRRAIRADKPPFVHAHWTYEFALGAIGSGVPALITIHDLPWSVLRYFRDPHRAARLLMAYAVAWRGRKFTAVSEDAARHFRRYIRPGAEITVVPNFIPDIVLRKTTGPQAHPQRALVFACMLQGWMRLKNATAALQAFALLRRSVGEARLVMIGRDYEEGGPAQVWARKHGCGDGVTFRGTMAYPDMLDYVRDKVDVVLVPSLGESFSMVALEGMTLGKPVIAGEDTTGVRDVLGRGTAGMLVNVRDPAAVAGAMLRLNRDAGLFEEFSRQGYQRALHLYKAETVVGAYESLYGEMLKG